MTKVIEITPRDYDNKWVQWELMDSQKKNGIGNTATWSRYKWVVTNVWDWCPVFQLDKLKTVDPEYKKETRKNGKLLYTFNI